MIIEFSVKNYKSIGEKVTLSFVADNKTKSSKHYAKNIGEGILHRAGIYGPNASGKSNLLEALNSLKKIMLPKGRVGFSVIINSEHLDSIKNNIFMPEESTEFQLIYLLKEIRFDYFIEIKNKEIINETLHYYPNRRKKLIFERENNKVTFNAGYKSVSVKVQELISEKSSVVSIINFYKKQLEEENILLKEYLSAIYDDFINVRKEELYVMSNVSQRLSANVLKEHYKDLDRESVLKVLQSADLGITDFNFTDDGIGEENLKLYFDHEGGNNIKEKLSFKDQSGGTKTLFILLPGIFKALSEGLVFVIDEIEDDLHPELATEIIEMFSNPSINKKNAQILFTSHAISLLDYMKRDEVWLVRKEQGKTLLDAVLEYSPRTTDNIQKRYIQGRYGALPELYVTSVFEEYYSENKV